MERLSDDEVQLMQYRCVRATPGPWKSWVEGRDFVGGETFIETQGEDIYLTGATIEDHDFIANAKQDIPRLIEERRVLMIMLGEIEIP